MEGEKREKRKLNLGGHLLLCYLLQAFISFKDYCNPFVMKVQVVVECVEVTYSFKIVHRRIEYLDTQSFNLFAVFFSCE